MNNTYENNDEYEIQDIPNEIEDTINVSENDNKSITKSTMIGIASGLTFGTLIGVAHYNHWINLKGVIRVVGNIASKI